jgi:hypothetical protein
LGFSWGGTEQSVTIPKREFLLFIIGPLKVSARSKLFFGIKNWIKDKWSAKRKKILSLVLVLGLTVREREFVASA